MTELSKNTVSGYIYLDYSDTHQNEFLLDFRDFSKTF